MNKQELESGLANFYGTDQWYRHALNKNMLYTDGVQFFAENAADGAYWFLDIVATELFQLQAKEPFLHIRLIVRDSKAVVTADDGGKGEKEIEVYRREIEFTDCPEGDWRFYLTDNVLLLPTEY